MVPACLALIQQMVASSIESVGFGYSVAPSTKGNHGETQDALVVQGRYHIPPATKTKAHYTRSKFREWQQKHKVRTQPQGSSDFSALTDGEGLVPKGEANFRWDPTDWSKPLYSTQFSYKIDYRLVSDFSLSSFEADFILSSISESNLTKLQGDHLYILSTNPSHKTVRVLGDRVTIARAAAHPFVLKVIPLDCGYRINHDGLNSLPFYIATQNLDKVPSHGLLTIEVSKPTTLDLTDIAALKTLGYDFSEFTWDQKLSIGTLNRTFLPNLLVLAHERKLQVTLILESKEQIELLPPASP